MLAEKDFNCREASKRFIEIRTQNGLKQEELANILGVALQTVKNYEKAGSDNVRDPANTDRVNAIAGMKIETLFKMATHFGVSADYLLGISSTRSQDHSIKSIVEIFGIAEHLVSLLINWKNLASIAEKSPADLTEDQKHIIQVADEMYPMQKNRYLNASEDFFSFFTCILDVIYDRPASLISNFKYARDAINNDGVLSGCDEESWIRAYELLAQSGYLALPSDNVGEWYLSKIANTIKVEMQNEIERFCYADLND